MCIFYYFSIFLHLTFTVLSLPEQRALHPSASSVSVPYTATAVTIKTHLHLGGVLTPPLTNSVLLLSTLPLCLLVIYNKIHMFVKRTRLLSVFSVLIKKCANSEPRDPPIVGMDQSTVRAGCFKRKKRTSRIDSKGK